MADGGGLENRCPVLNGTVGSNPTPSAIFFCILCGEMAELVEGARLLSECTLKRCTEGSNPSLSAIISESQHTAFSHPVRPPAATAYTLLRHAGTLFIILLNRPILSYEFFLQG